MNNPTHHPTPGLVVLVQALDLDPKQEELWGCAIDATYNEYSILRCVKKSLPEGRSFQLAVEQAQAAWARFYGSLTASQRSLITGAMHLYQSLATSARPLRVAGWAQAA